MMGCLVAFFKWVALIIAFVIFSTLGGPVGIIGCAAVLAVLVWIRLKGQKKSEAALAGGLDAQGKTVHMLNEQTVAKILIIEELHRQQGEAKLVAKATVTRRMIYTIAYLVLNGLFVAAMFASTSVLPLTGILTGVYIFLMTGCGTPDMLCKAAKRNQDRTFADLVKEETYDERREGKLKKLMTAGALAFVASVGAVFLLFGEESWTFETYQEGYMVTAYSPGIFSDVVEVPETFEGKPVLAIGKQVFSDVDTIKEFRLPRQLRSIGSGAFKDSSGFETIVLPESLRELQGEAFMNCTSLKEIRIPAGVTEIRGNTFEECSSLKKVELHDGIVEIHAFAFRRCTALEEITLPSGIREIKEQTFAECAKLRRIHIPEGVVKIGARSFFACTQLEEVYVPGTVAEIRSSAFRECKHLYKIVLPSDASVDERAFKDSPTEITYK